MSMWWLQLSPEEMRQASTCRGCGCGGADIDLGLCYGCFSAQQQATQCHQVADVARRYGQYDRADEWDRRASGAS